MTLSAFDMYSIGIGPSSSHTVGPMRAALRFVELLEQSGVLGSVSRVQVDLFGSLGATGLGHGSDKAVLLGLAGERPESVDANGVDAWVAEVRASNRLPLGGSHTIEFTPSTDLIMHLRQNLPAHPNGMTCQAFTADSSPIAAETYYSVGGGFVMDAEEMVADRLPTDDVAVPYPFSTGAELLEQCQGSGLRISDLMLANELAWRTEAEVRADLLAIWAVMQECVQNGCSRTETMLPGGLSVARRAPKLLAALEANPDDSDPIRAMDWVNLFALAVNEENASGGRVVTAPTNGAAGIVPAVLHYYNKFFAESTNDGIVRFLLTAAAVGMLIKTNASISGAEVGCQGEVGSACAMAAAALCEVMGGTPEQVENAAEIGIEHNLGLTCDPIGGLVQIPCIERNAIASNKAINAARMALQGDGRHKVSLDSAIRTMRETGADMKSKYKETSRGGLAVNVVEC